MPLDCLTMTVELEPWPSGTAAAMIRTRAGRWQIEDLRLPAGGWRGLALGRAEPNPSNSAARHRGQVEHYRSRPLVLCSGATPGLTIQNRGRRRPSPPSLYFGKPMRLAIFALAVVASPCLTLEGTSQADSGKLDPFTQVALVVAAFDRLDADCQRRGGFAPAEARAVSAWQEANGVARFRSRLQRQDNDPAQRREAEHAAAQLIAALTRQGVGGCAAAVALTRLPAARLAEIWPEALSAREGPVQVAPRPSADEPSPTGPTKSAPEAALQAEIESFGFDTRLTMGVSGFLTSDIYPVVLFRNGEALTDASGLAFPGGPSAHRRANPARWTRWRRDGGKLQIEGRKGWEPLAFQTTYPKLPDGFQLEGRYRSLTGSGTVAIGGTEAVAAWREYRFSRDGRVVRGGGAGAQSEAAGGSVVTSNVAPNRRGRYRVEGLVLVITYDDGSSERRILITDPGQPKAIWLDGVGYVR